ncbi:fimbrial protein [Hafnia paralvei]|uniref:fimbrial protein n=1 Tax=Hafnia paralvei TaxID=546367 RepID=UPI0010784F36|nr:type 1 fimbrial protein [Hafnia paralvei]
MKFVKSCFFLLNLFLWGSTAWAIPDTELLHSWGSDISLSGPADSPNNAFGKIIGASGQQRQVICNNNNISYDLAKIEYSPVAVFTTTVERAGSPTKPLYLYETGIKGFNYSPFIRGDSFTSGITGNGVSNPAPPQTMVVWTGNMANSYRVSPGFWVYTVLYLYRGIDRTENVTLIPRQPLFRFTCYDKNNVAQETTTIVASDIHLNIKVSSCTPDSKNISVSMGGIPVSNIENAASSTLINTKQQTFSLKCDPNIQILYSVVDLNDPTNNTTTSTLTADSTAAGVGYAITSPSGTRLKFGPDGSAAGIPGQTKYFLGTAGTNAINNPFSYQLGFSYVRKPEEAIQAGSAKSLIGITYSYQ